MSKRIEIELPEKLRQYVELRGGTEGVHGTVAEYIRDLIRHDYERDEEQKWNRLLAEVGKGIIAPESDFHSVTAEEINAQAKAERALRDVR